MPAAASAGIEGRSNGRKLFLRRAVGPGLHRDGLHCNMLLLLILILK
jgi:hypothetical protein